MGQQGPQGGSVGEIILPKGWSGTYIPPKYQSGSGNCLGCGAALRKRICEYCGRDSGNPQLEATPRTVRY